MHLIEDDRLKSVAMEPHCTHGTRNMATGSMPNLTCNSREVPDLSCFDSATLAALPIHKRATPFSCAGQKDFPYQKAFMNGIEAMYGYSVKSQQDILRRLWTKKTNDVKKNTGNIKSFLTTTRK